MEIILNIDLIKWEQPPGFDDGIQQSVIVDTLDQVAKQGMRVRLVRFLPGAHTNVPFIHDYDEVVYLVDGHQSLIEKTSLLEIETYQKGICFVRPAATFHGPFSTDIGCLLLEIHSYPPNLL